MKMSVVEMDRQCASPRSSRAPLLFEASPLPWLLFVLRGGGGSDVPAGHDAAGCFRGASVRAPGPNLISLPFMTTRPVTYPNVKTSRYLHFLFWGQWGCTSFWTLMIASISALPLCFLRLSSYYQVLSF
jgi:hypothetical protein